MRFISATVLLVVGCWSIPCFAAKPRFDRNLFYVPSSAPSGTWALMEKAAQLASKSPHCVEVTGGAWSTKEEAAEDGSNHPGDQFYVTCQSDQAGPIPGVPASFNLYYSYQDLKSGAIKHRPVPISDKVAIAECRQQILKRLKYPSSARLLLIQYGAKGTDNNQVIYNFTALNGFGNRVPQRGICTINPQNEIDLTVTNR